ncbi:MAG: transporter permease [Paenibacillaceae bacterium]|jgi:ABC-2 type transport system permease protein|nr:transporter permease [Paenibacillaceae bacterium]
MAADLNKLWGKRVRAFWKEAGIYWSYAARSGLSAFMLLFIIVGSYAYIKILQATPVDYPYWRITTPLMAAVLALSPIRTFLKPADTVFLAPAEHKLRGYWLRSISYSFLFQAAAILAVLLLIWPLYVHCEPDASAPGVVFTLLAAKLLAVLSRFHESRLLFSVHRAFTGIIRWLLSAIVAFSLLVQGAAPAWGAVALGTVILTVSIRLLPTHRIPWEYWIHKESRHLKNHYAFFSWFADVPKLPVKPKARMALSRQVDRLAFDRSETYRYLYAKTLIRSEWVGIVVRITAIAVVAFMAVENAVAETLIYAAAVVMISATLSSLEQSHRYSFWLELYPVSKQQRVKAIVQTCFQTLVPVNVILAAAFAVFHSNHILGLIAGAAGFLYIWYYTRISLRKRAASFDE